MRDGQMLVTINPFTLRSECAGKHTKGVTSDYSSWLTLFTNFGTLYNGVMRKQVQRILGISRSRLCTLSLRSSVFHKVNNSMTGAIDLQIPLFGLSWVSGKPDTWGR